MVEPLLSEGILRLDFPFPFLLLYRIHWGGLYNPQWGSTSSMIYFSITSHPIICWRLKTKAVGLLLPSCGLIGLTWAVLLKSHAAQLGWALKKHWVSLFLCLHQAQVSLQCGDWLPWVCAKKELSSVQGFRKPVCTTLVKVHGSKPDTGTKLCGRWGELPLGVCLPGVHHMDTLGKGRLWGCQAVPPGSVPHPSVSIPNKERWVICTTVQVEDEQV